MRWVRINVVGRLGGCPDEVKTTAPHGRDSVSALRVSVSILAAVLYFWVPARPAVITTTLQPETVEAWNRYIANFEKTPLGSRALLNVKAGKVTLEDVNPNGEVAGGYIHHWIGAELIPNVTVEKVEGVLEDYGHYADVYAPDLKQASAKKTGAHSYDVRLITERIEGIGLHFAFDMHSRVEFRHEAGNSLVESRSYLIRESNSGHAPYTDLLPEGSDHGILWRLNSYWRLRQMGSGVYAECQAISLSRRPLFGTMGQVKNRARDSLGFTLRRTAARSSQ
jgi:hypothetical protein